jgi:PAS domain S-box-containing protein
LVLILDDDAAVVEMTALYLRTRGFDTLTCASAAAALEKFHGTGGDVDALIADVTLSNGRVAMASNLNALTPVLKILFVSGHSWTETDAALFNRLPVGPVRFLRKPYSVQDLVAQLGELLNSTPHVRRSPKTVAKEPAVSDAPGLRDALEPPIGLLDMAHDAIVVRALDGRIRYWNHGAETLYGWSKDEAIGRVTHDLLKTVFPAPFEDIQKALRENRRWQGELQHTVRSKGTVTVSSRWAVREAENQQIEILEINRDITAQKKVEEELRAVNRERALRIAELQRAEQRFRTLLESAPDAMVIVDGSGQIVLVNQETEKQFGYRRIELLGHNVDMLVPERFRGRHPGRRSLYVSERRVRPMGKGLELFGLRKNGEEFPVEISLSPIETAEGVLIGSSIRDISGRKSLEKALSGKNTQLENADKTKDLFLAGMSHGLRAPLHTIIGFADLLAEELKGPLNDQQKHFVRHILDDSQHLLELVNDILDLSKIQAGELQLRWEIFDASAAIEEVVSSFRSQVQAKSIRLETQVGESPALHADHLRFKQVLYNLLSNAIKFTPEGGAIRIAATPRDNFIEIAVSDTGIGIPKEQHEAVFDGFHQVSKTAKSGQAGTGLGLSITRALVEQHGGRIWLESEHGQGSRFILTIPAGKPDMAHAGR